MTKLAQFVFGALYGRSAGNVIIGSPSPGVTEFVAPSMIGNVRLMVADDFDAIRQMPSDNKPVFVLTGSADDLGKLLHSILTGGDSHVEDTVVP
jgi:hypothetical protein